MPAAPVPAAVLYDLSYSLSGCVGAGGIFVESGLAFGANNPQPDKANQGIEQEDFKAKAVAAEPRFRVALDNVREHGGEQAYPRHPALPHLPARRQPEDKEREDGAIRVTHRREKGVDDAVVIQFAEEDDDPAHQEGKRQVHANAPFLLPGALGV